MQTDLHMVFYVFFCEAEESALRALENAFITHRDAGLSMLTRSVIEIHRVVHGLSILWSPLKELVKRNFRFEYW